MSRLLNPLGVRRSRHLRRAPRPRPTPLGDLMTDRINEIQRRANAATPGPWEEYPKYGPHFYAYLGSSYLRGVGTINFGEGDDAAADLALTLNAQQDIDFLLAEVARLRGEVATLAAENQVLERALGLNEGAAA